MRISVRFSEKVRVRVMVRLASFRFWVNFSVRARVGDNVGGVDSQI